MLMSPVASSVWLHCAVKRGTSVNRAYFRHGITSAAHPMSSHFFWKKMGMSVVLIRKGFAGAAHLLWYILPLGDTVFDGEN
jgi:hypothetical protein